MCAAVYQRYINQAVIAGITYLISRQSEDGFWRDYHLPPGMSEAWSTSWTGWALSHFISHTRVQQSLGGAAQAVISCHHPGGWGYNRSLGPDADSTAWAIRFLAVLCALDDAVVENMKLYLDTNGRAHTFREDWIGAWGDAHPDVTSVVGLALLSANAPQKLIRLVRGAVVDGRTCNGGWRSYWWSTDTYATAWSLEFLARSGGIPEAAAREACEWLQMNECPENAFEASHYLLALLAAGGHKENAAIKMVNILLELAHAKGGWPPSPVLLIPSKTDVSKIDAGPFPDAEGIMTTAISTVALHRWSLVSNQ